MDEMKCGNCDEVLPPVADAFCSFCQHPIERTGSQMGTSSAGYDLGGFTIDGSKLFAIALLFLSVLVGLATLLLAADSGYRILTEESIGFSPAGRAGWKTGQCIGAFMRTVIGATLAASSYRGWLVLSKPNEYSSTQ